MFSPAESTTWPEDVLPLGTPELPVRTRRSENDADAVIFPMSAYARPDPSLLARGKQQETLSCCEALATTMRFRRFIEQLFTNEDPVIARQWIYEQTRAQNRHTSADELMRLLARGESLWIAAPVYFKALYDEWKSRAKYAANVSA